MFFKFLIWRVIFLITETTLLESCLSENSSKTTLATTSSTYQIIIPFVLECSCDLRPYFIARFCNRGNAEAHNDTSKTVYDACSRTGVKSRDSPGIYLLHTMTQVTGIYLSDRTTIQARVCRAQTAVSSLTRDGNSQATITCPYRKLSPPVLANISQHWHGSESPCRGQNNAVRLRLSLTATRTLI
jgi:hypothetical protein